MPSKDYIISKPSQAVRHVIEISLETAVKIKFHFFPKDTYFRLLFPRLLASSHGYSDASHQNPKKSGEELSVVVELPASSSCQFSEEIRLSVEINNARSNFL